MGARLNRATGEAAKFSAVNIVATIVAMVLFNLLTHGIAGVYDGPLNHRPLTSYLLANCVGMLISFWGSSRFAFRHRRPSGPGGGAVKFFAVNLTSFVIPISCLWVSRNLLEWDSALADNVAGNVVGALLGMAFRFWAFRRFVFKKRGLTATSATPEGYIGAHVDQDTSWTALLGVGSSRAGSPGAGSTGLDSAGVARPRHTGPELGPDEAELVEHPPQ